jgi:SAM-dependent methyltransferase
MDLEGVMTCNICDKQITELKYTGSDLPVLKDVIGGGRRKAVCNHCGSSDRERLVWYGLKRLNKFIVGCEILHIAPEKRIKEKILLDEKYTLGENYICGDLINFGKGVEKIDLANINYPDNSFDIVICNHVLEHIPNDIQAMREIYRVLKVGGHAILQVPIREVERTIENEAKTDKKRLELYGQIDHVRIYGQDYFDRLLSVGFRIGKITPDKNHAFNPKEKLFVCLK